MSRFAWLIEPPFNDRAPDGTLTGCDVDLARWVFAMAGILFEPVETQFAQLLPGLAAGRWRMTTGLFITEERRRIAAFSRPIWALPDGLLVRGGNPLGLDGYRSAARCGCRLAVIRDQIQHRSATALGVRQDRILIFDTYAAAAQAVAEGRADAYASVARAHSAFAAGRPDLEVATVPAEEIAPAFGAFAFDPRDEAFRAGIDDALQGYLGTAAHRAMMGRYGFSDAEIDLIAPR